MLVSSFCASRPRDATSRMSATERVLHNSVAGSQQQLRRSSSSVAAALQPALNPLRVAASSTSRRGAAAPRGRTRAAAAQHRLRHSSKQQSCCTAVAADDGSGPETMSGRGGLFLKALPGAVRSPQSTILFWKELGFPWAGFFLFFKMSL